jgi:hypothetical protein
MQISINHLKKDNDLIPAKYTCDADGISPEIRWNEAPEDTKSYALSMLDPDAVGGTYLHWLICDIPLGTELIPEGGPIPQGAVSILNTSGRNSYVPPCPPSGRHRYIFTIYALDVETIEESIDMDNFISIIEKHTIEKVVFTALYQRS